MTVQANLNLDTEREDEELEDDELGAQEPTSAESRKIDNISGELSDIKKMLANSNASNADKAAVKKLDTAFKHLLDNGYKPEQLEALAVVAQALLGDMRDEYGVERKKEQASSHRDKVAERLFKEIDDQIKEMPPALARAARKEIFLECEQLLESDDTYAGFKRAFFAGKMPASEQFEKIVRTVSRNYLKESGIVKKDSSKSAPQLDTSNSRTRGGGTLTTEKNGKLDQKSLQSLTETERRIYLTTYNSNKNPEIALEAMKVLGKIVI